MQEQWDKEFAVLQEDLFDNTAMMSIPDEFFADGDSIDITSFNNGSVQIMLNIEGVSRSITITKEQAKTLAEFLSEQSLKEEG